MDTKQIRVAARSMRRIDLMDSPFELTGLPWACERGFYDRIPEDLMPSGATDLFKEIATETSGGIARIRTNSSRVFFEGRLRRVKGTLYHMSCVGRSGFDFWIRRDGEEKFSFQGTSVPIDYGTTTVICEVAVKRNSLYDARPEMEASSGFYELRIMLPIYNVFDEACIYVEPDCEVLSPQQQAYHEQVLFYGSSITQGACASRPSQCYTNLLALALDCPILNFGFSGHCMAEPEMADLILKQKMDIFVYDYDHNAPDIPYLKKTHQPFFQHIRKGRPELPVIFTTKCDYNCSLDDNDARRAIIRSTYEQARLAGDENVYFVDGKNFFEGIRDFATVDGVHPNDLGFARMAEAFQPLLKALLDGDRDAAKRWQP